MTLIETQPETEHIARTRAIIPALRARADEAAALRRVPAENIDLLREAGSFKTIQSRRNGGFGFGMRTHVEVIASLAEGCAATAWVAGVTQAHSWMLSHFPTAAQDDAYANPDNVVSAVIGPRGVAVKTADGFRLSGFWPFASGNENSQWLILGGVVKDESGEVIDEGDFLIPSDAVTRLDDWFVNGLTGTGSCSVKVEDLHVPAHRFLSLPALVMGASPGLEACDEWNLHCAPVPVLALALCGGAIGIARAALASFPALVQGKTIAYTADDQYNHPLTHIQAGNAAMLLHEGELLLTNCADEIDAAAREGRTLSFETRARMRLDCAQGVRRCLEAVEILFHASGASGIRLSSPLTRAVADLRAINQHGLLNLETNQELYGRIVLGLPQNTPLI
ncbi:MAG: 3-hydroxy-9,10-secoandrosta,3,5(10)-triene-9, 17-dione monooxygenase [Actinomycetota bacterium]|jgi:3-hydroxy-9,10-secoandrosta-1,3,5(10)-triene-9,17-dione monooxygenase